MSDHATEDRRKHKRVEVNLKVKVKHADVDEFVEHFAKNISRGGIFLESNEPKPKGTVILFEIQLKGGETVIRGKGEVMWSRDRSPGDEKSGAPGVGLKFLALDKPSKEIIKRIIQTKEKREVERRVTEDAAASRAVDESRDDQVDIDIDVQEPQDEDARGFWQRLKRSWGRSLSKTLKNIV